MKKAGMTLAVLMAACLTLKAQATGGGSPYMLHATIEHENNGHMLISASSPRPLSQALTGLNREYGWVVDYEEGMYSAGQMLRTSDNHYRLIGGAFKAELAQPRTGTEAEETSILQQLVYQYNSAIGTTIGPPFTLVHRSSSVRYDVISQSGEAPILDTLIQLPLATRAVDSTIEGICALVGAARGITFERGGLADTDLHVKQVTLGGDQPLPAREFLLQALDRADYEKTYGVAYEPSNGHFVIGIQTAVRVERTVTGGTTFFLIPNPAVHEGAAGAR